MRRPSALSVVVLVVLLFTPVTSLSAGGLRSAVPEAPAETFNVELLSQYPGTFALVAVDGSQAFLGNYGWVYLYDITDPRNPAFKAQIGGVSSNLRYTDLSAKNNRLAAVVQDVSISPPPGRVAVYDVYGGVFEHRCHLAFDSSSYGRTNTVLLSGNYAYVGLDFGLAVLDVQNPINGECQLKTIYAAANWVYAIALKGNLLYLAEQSGLTVLSVANPASPVFQTRNPIGYWMGSLAASPVSDDYVYAQSNNGLLIVPRSGAPVHYGPTGTVAVVADDKYVYLGTQTDLRVLDVQQPTAPQLIGMYTDPSGNFYLDLAAGNGLVHTPAGIYRYTLPPAGLLLEAGTAGVTLNGIIVPAGANRLVKVGDVVRLEGRASARLLLRCTAGGPVRAIANLTGGPAMTTMTIGTEIPFEALACPRPLQAPLQIDPNALPLGLESGSLRVEVVVTVGALELSTPNASTLAQGGTTFGAAHDPDLGVSQFDCLAGTLLVQPTAAGAPPLTLGPLEFVRVTAQGAGPIQQFLTLYLPLIQK